MIQSRDKTRVEPVTLEYGRNTSGVNTKRVFALMGAFVSGFVALVFLTVGALLLFFIVSRSRADQWSIPVAVLGFGCVFVYLTTVLASVGKRNKNSSKDAAANYEPHI